MLKHAIVFAAVTLAFALSARLLASVIGWTSPGMALMLFFCFLGLAKFGEPIYMMKMPASLRGVREWEMRGRVYRALGVPAFGLLLKHTPLRLLNTGVYLSAKRDDGQRVRRQVESAEAIHFWSAVLLMPYLAWCAATGAWIVLGGFLLVQVLGNAYPIMHLRWVRGRLERLCSRAARPGR